MMSRKSFQRREPDPGPLVGLQRRCEQPIPGPIGRRCASRWTRGSFQVPLLLDEPQTRSQTRTPCCAPHPAVTAILQPAPCSPCSPHPRGPATSSGTARYSRLPVQPVWLRTGCNTTLVLVIELRFLLIYSVQKCTALNDVCSFKILGSAVLLQDHSMQPTLSSSQVNTLCSH